MDRKSQRTTVGQKARQATITSPSQRILFPELYSLFLKVKLWRYLEPLHSCDTVDRSHKGPSVPTTDTG
ncbi:hypothetical protein SFRURICE_013305 [Spodoptera frugiperda]|nr:hypothetical protein SFRURICE_013305 [Spodoptera frugiperda]